MSILKTAGKRCKPWSESGWNGDDGKMNTKQHKFFMIGLTTQRIDLHHRLCFSVMLKERDFHITIIPFKNNDAWCWAYLYRKPNVRATVIKNINPFPYWFNSTKWKFKEKKLRREGNDFLICEGCGQGINTWRIRNPNHHPLNSKIKRYLNCCDGCVNFYDFFCSKKKIIGWKKIDNGKFKTICEKGVNYE